MHTALANIAQFAFRVGHNVVGSLIWLVHEGAPDMTRVTVSSGLDTLAPGAGGATCRMMGWLKADALVTDTDFRGLPVIR
jgi:hypothetical protein